MESIPRITESRLYRWYLHTWCQFMLSPWCPRKRHSAHQVPTQTIERSTYFAPLGTAIRTGRANRSIDSVLQRIEIGVPRGLRAMVPFLKPSAAASCWRAFRRFALMAACLIAFLELAGVPHLRVSYQSQAGHILVANYWSVMGRERVVAGQVAQGCPLIVVLPLKRSVLTHAASWFSGDE
jgi:hypothetical protein